MKTYGGVDIEIHIFLTMALVGGEWWASRPCRFTPGTYFIGGWVDPRASLDDMEKWKFFILKGLELPPPLPTVVQPIASRYTNWAIRRLLLKTLCLNVVLSECGFLRQDWHSGFWNTWKCSNLHEHLFEHYFFFAVFFSSRLLKGYWDNFYDSPLINLSGCLDLLLIRILQTCLCSWPLIVLQSCHMHLSM
jgi:hypothetical protein